LRGEAWPAAINLGPNPTFGEGSLKFEAHVVGFDDDLYGQRLEVDILTRLRDIQRFPSIDALRGQLDRDLFETRRAFESLGAPKNP
jgi:riboflavin kinase/FMN adenylyltransferase